MKERERGVGGAGGVLFLANDGQTEMDQSSTNGTCDLIFESERKQPPLKRQVECFGIPTVCNQCASLKGYPASSKTTRLICHGITD